jgi:integrase
VLLAAWCGLRFRELTGLRRRDINLDEETITIEQAAVTVGGARMITTPKSAAGRRTVYLPPHVIADVRHHPRPSVVAMGTLTNWTMLPKHAYSPAARQEFLKEADYFLVAEALGGSHVVVTFEGSHPTAVKKVYIPDVCDGVGVTYERPFRVYEHLGLCLS